MEKVKWGVIGAGGIADRRTIPGMLLAENAELVAVMEVNQELAQGIAAKYNVPNAYTNVDDLLANKEIDAVYIASPVTVHYEQCKKAAMAGKHILVEKPLAFSIEQGKEIIWLCESKGVLLAAGLMMRYHAYHQKAREIVQAGTLGSIVSVRAQLTCWYPDIPGAWRQQYKTSGGGSLMDMGVHCIDLLQHITGARVVSVAALAGTKTFNYEVEDSASVLLQFDSGIYGYVDSNFNIPDNAAECRLEIYGTKGSILASGTLGQEEGGNFALTLADDAGYDASQNRTQDGKVKVDVVFGNMYTKEIESFGKSITSGQPLFVPASEALQVQCVVEKAYLSSKEKTFVEVPVCI